MSYYTYTIARNHTSMASSMSCNSQIFTINIYMVPSNPDQSSLDTRDSNNISPLRDFSREKIDGIHRSQCNCQPGPLSN